MSAETELSLIEWALGIATTVGFGFATTISLAFSRMRDEHTEDMTTLKSDTGKAIDAMWERINRMTDGQADLRESAAQKFVTKDDLHQVTEHIDRQFAEVNQTIRDSLRPVPRRSS